MHLVDFNVWKPSAWHLLEILIVAVKQVCGINTDADGALDMEEEASKSKKSGVMSVWGGTVDTNQGQLH